MKSHKFTSGIINVAPRKLAKIKFSNGEVIEPGIELAAHVIKKPPIVTWDFRQSSLYALLLINADANKLNEKLTPTQICHWLIVNIPENTISKGRTINSYTMPQYASLGSETESCILLIFKQNNLINADQFIFKINEEGCICVQSFDYLTKYNLGEPIAGNYFKIKF